MLACAYPRSSEGPSPETCRRRSGEWRPAAAARNRRPREVRDPARQALRPGCKELAAQIRKKCRRWKRGPRPKIATVERRRGERVPPDARRASVSADRRAPKRATTEILRLSALRPPLMGRMEKRKSETRAQQRAAGTREAVLFEVVRREMPRGTSDDPPHPEERARVGVRASRRMGGPARAPHASRRRAAPPGHRQAAQACLRCAAPQHEGEGAFASGPRKSGLLCRL
jgi:hypothetical protein